MTAKTNSKNTPENAPENAMEQTALLCAQAVLDKKGENVLILDVRNHCTFADYFVLVSAFSAPQVQAISDNVKSELKKNDHKVLAVEGYQEARWVLIDSGSVVVHVFIDAIREYYKLEELWAGAKRVSIPAEYYGPGATNTQRENQNLSVR